MAAPDEVRDLIIKRRVSVGGGARAHKPRTLNTARDRKADAHQQYKKGRKM